MTSNLPGGCLQITKCMEFKELIRARYSCKAYDSGRQLSPETLAAILEPARIAPPPKNLQE